jgi:hypothetical protein
MSPADKGLRWQLNRALCSQQELVFGITDSFSKERSWPFVTATQTLSPDHKPHAAYLHALRTAVCTLPKKISKDGGSFSPSYLRKRADIEKALE